MTNLIVKSEVKRVAGEFNVSRDVYDKLQRETTELVMKAAKRAEANGRKTICARDL